MRYRALPRRVLLALLLTSGFPSAGRAQVWNGSADDDWTNPLNWTPNAVPAAGQTAT